MRKATKLLFAASIGLALCSSRAAWAADDLDKVLRKLDDAAARFHSTSADFQFDSVETDPVPETDVQKGTVYYERAGAGFRMAVHIREENSKPVPKIMVVSGGVFKLYEQLLDQVTTSNKVGKYESYLVLGFGASGKDLEQKWTIKYLGPETLDGVKTEKLELVAKDPDVLKLFPKVTVWVDPERGVSLKQVFEEGSGQYRVCVYFNIKVNESLPGGAFTFKTDAKTQYVNR
jgi:outer membrane lipoprotein-sorting protein